MCIRDSHAAWSHNDDDHGYTDPLKSRPPGSFLEPDVLVAVNPEERGHPATDKWLDEIRAGAVKKRRDRSLVQEPGLGALKNRIPPARFERTLGLVV